MPSPDSATPFLRHATRDDVPHIHSLIHLLAAYEHATSSVVATPASLTNTLSFPPFPSPGYARCMLLFAPSDAAQPAGMALYFFNYSTWRGAPGVYVEDLFVREEYRGRGYGGRLLAEMARVVKGVGGGRLEWSVLKWNEPSIRFYEGLGAEKMEEWFTMRVDGEALGKLAERGQGTDDNAES